MQKIRRKLHSNSGASMIMALLLLLVGIVTSAVIISAAMNAALSIKEEKGQEQAYLTVSSAAELIRDELENGNSNYKKIQTDVTTTNWWGQSSTKSTTEEKVGDGVLGTVIQAAVKYLDSYPKETFHKNYTVSSGNLEDVSAELFIKKSTEEEEKYSLTIWFSGGKDSSQCKMALTMDGLIETTTSSTENHGYSSTTKTQITTTTVSWSNARLQKKEAAQE